MRGTDDSGAVPFTEEDLDLPVLPRVAGRVLALCQREDSDAGALSAVLHQDPTLAAHVLRVANSATFAPAVPIASLQQAIGRMGLTRVAEIALAVAVRGELFAGGEHAARLGALWRHAVATGFYAKEIARLRRRNVETAFLCGLMHDVGKAVMLANLEVFEHAGGPLDEVLEEFHTAVGVLLAQGWQLPGAIVAAMAHHHDWQNADEHVDAVRVTHLADRLAAHALAGDDEEVEEEEVRGLAVLEHLDLYPDELDDLLALADRARGLAEEMQ